MHNYFSDDYSAARQAFLNAANNSGALVESYHNPVTGVDGLFTDVALCGPVDADHALVLMSGVHGVEGFAGSAIQAGLLSEGVADRLPANTRLVMIHAVNPYGFACLRRFNEDNVDLNRNFVDHSGPYPESTEYDRLASIAVPGSLSPMANALSLLKIACLRLVYGLEKLQRALTYGQYSHPDGLFYGGTRAVWSNEVLHEIVGQFLANTTKVIIVDFHTGLGPYGVGEIILNDPEDDPAYRRACRWWGHERVKSTVSGESVSAHLSGTVKLAFDTMLPDAEVTGVGLEFGTLPPIEVFLAMRAENWLHHYGGDNYPDAGKIKQKLLRAFYPDDDDWRAEIWRQGCDVVEHAMKAIAH